MKSLSVLFVLLFLFVAATTAFAAPAADSAPSERGIPVIVEPVVETPDDLFTIVRPPRKPLLLRCPDRLRCVRP